MSADTLEEMKPEQSGIATIALKTLTPFPTSYLCEEVFSSVTATKTMSRSRLGVRNTMQASLSAITPR